MILQQYTRITSKWNNQRSKRNRAAVMIYYAPVQQPHFFSSVAGRCCPSLKNNRLYPLAQSINEKWTSQRERDVYLNLLLLLLTLASQHGCFLRAHSSSVDLAVRDQLCNVNDWQMCFQGWILRLSNDLAKITNHHVLRNRLSTLAITKANNCRGLKIECGAWIHQAAISAFALVI